MSQKKLTTSTPHQRPMPRPPIRNTSNLNSNSCSEILSESPSEKKKRKIERKKERASNLTDSKESGDVPQDNNDESDDSSDSSDEEFYSQEPQATEVSHGLGTKYIVCIVIALAAAVGFASFSNSSVAQKPAEEQSITKIRKDFKSQSDELWASFEAGVNDVVTLNKPSIFIFLYKEEAEDTLNRLLKRLAQFATCNITSCSQKPLELTSRTLNSPEIKGDYGVVLETYQSDLEEKGVLIVKRLETVSGASAQAFHSICDEITPFIPKLLIMFTIKVEEESSSSKESFKSVEELLQGPWKQEMKPEVFNALIARITNMIIQVNP